tara:strand:- start:110 stop:592 length:483 start_codon:yes stop_codon:yes gene_type:complete
MTLFIKVDENNNPIGHPFLESNLQQVFPSHDWSSGPMSGYLEFVQVQPDLGIYQKFDESIGADISLATKHNGLEYKLIDGKIKQFWHILDLTDTERKALQDKIKADWAALDPAGPASWIFDETTCSYKAPVDLPSDAASPDNPDGVFYEWNEETLSWDKI